MTDLTSTPIASGEILLLPAALQDAIDDAVDRAGTIADDAEARTAFAQAFAQAFAEALHRRGLVVVTRARSGNTAAVSVDTYSLALAGKYEAEERLGWLRKLVLGDAELVGAGRALLDVAGDAILSLAGRAPPENGRAWAELAMLRLRGAAAILAGKRDLSELPAFDAALIDFFNGET